MPNWQQIGSVEVCVGTDGAVGVSFDGDRVCVAKKTMYLGWCSKADFEADYCKPRHRLIESCDGSVCVVSTEEQGGNPVRMAAVRARRGEPVRWGATWAGNFDWSDERQDAIDRAIRYVEKGE